MILTFFLSILLTGPSQDGICCGQAWKDLYHFLEQVSVAAGHILVDGESADFSRITTPRVVVEKCLESKRHFLNLDGWGFPVQIESVESSFSVADFFKF